MKKTVALLLAVILLATSAFLLVGCDNRTAEQFFADAKAYMENGEYAKAAADYVHAYEADPQNLDAYVGAMQAYEQLGVTYRIYEICDDLIENMPNNATGYLNAASFYVAADDYASALEYYLKQIEMVPDQPLGYEKAVKIYYSNSDLDASRTYAEKMIEQFPDTIDGYIYLIEILTEEKKIDEAIAMGKTVVELFPEDVSGYVYLGYLYFDEGDYDAVTEIIDRSPDEWDTRIIGLRRSVRGKEPITLEDKSLETAIRNYREIDDGKEILLEDVFNISTIEIKGGINPKITIGESVTPLDNAVETLVDLQYFESLTTIELKETTFSDYSPIGTLPSLSTLGIHDSNVSDISFIANLSSTLVTLTVENTEVSDIGVLEQMLVLQQLNLNDNQIAKLPSFETMASLTVLNLAGNKLADISALAGAAGLKELTLDNNVGIIDLEPLRALENLTKISVVGCSVLDLSPVEHAEEVISE